MRSSQPGQACSASTTPRILISIPTGFQLRQFVHSGVLGLLLKHGFQALLLSPNRAGEGFAAHLPAEGVQVCAVDLKNGQLFRRYWAARHGLLLNSPPTEALRNRSRNLHENYPWVALATKAAHGLLQSYPTLRDRFLAWERFILNDKAINAILAAHPVDVILLGSPGFMAQDAVLLHAAVLRGIPVAAAVLSWDNLSSKGMINPLPDRLLVWSEHMRQEAMRLQQIPSERIVETGAPLYDVFANPGRFGSRAESLQKLGLDPARRLILYGTNHAGHFPDEIEVVKQVVRWVEEDAFDVPCQLWIRLHPQAVSGPYKVLMEPYRQLVSKRVKVEFPPVLNSDLLWDLPKDDLGHLVSLLRDSDVVINMASTLAIDAAIFDKPVASIAYDPSGPLPYERSVRRYYDYTHMANVVRAGSARLATSHEHLKRIIANYLANPELDRECRRQIVEQQFGRIDGGSSKRLVTEIVEMTRKGILNREREKDTPEPDPVSNVA